MEWDNKERRKADIQDHRPPTIICKQEDKINEIHLTVKETNGDIKVINTRINGALEKIADHISEGVGYRKLLVGTALSLVLSIMGGIFTAATIAYNLGEYTRQIKVNTGRLEKIEAVSFGWSDLSTASKKAP